ncbi:MAG: cupin domain-containing protein [Ilumatobacteraceae bacterium]
MVHILDARSTIELLGLERHPEGGWYAETWRDESSSAIWFLLEATDRSGWHRVIGSAEVWLHHLGDPLRLDIAAPGSTPTSIVLGADLSAGQRPQAVVPPDAWQAATPVASGQVGYTLVSCTVAPPFRFEAFDLAPPGWSPTA